MAAKKILIADDQGSIRSVFKLVLQDTGFTHIDSATDGADALKHLTCTGYDLIICDWNMPKLSGMEVLQSVRQCEATKTLPFMMVTSSSETERVKVALGEGVSDYLIKPFQPAAFSSKAVKLLATSTHVPALFTVTDPGDAVEAGSVE
jgi:two-component system chemotaxis response regulator CheY